jgi:hypothetical protein
VSRFLFFILIAIPAQVYGSPAIQWHDGVVVLANDQLLTGQVSIHPRHNFVIFNAEGKQTVLPAKKIHQVYYYDEISNINRKFISVVKDHVGYHRYELYEIVVWGDVMVLRKQMMKSAQDDHCAFNYFIYHNTEVFPVKHFKKKIYPMLNDRYSVALADFAKEKRLNFNFTQDIISILKFYNELVINSGSIAKR